MLIYMTRKDERWAGYDFKDYTGDAWDTIDRASQELWDALPPTAIFSIEKPDGAVVFTDLTALIQWVDEANTERYVVAIDLPYDEPYEAWFNDMEDAIAFAEEQWYGMAESEQEISKIAVLKKPDMDVIWCRGL